MRNRITKTIAATTCALALLGLAACGENDASGSTDNAAGDNGGGEPSDDMTSEQPSDDMSGDEPDMAAQLVGPGCADYAEMVPDGAGSVQGMAQDPVATAASNNPLLKTLVAAVSGQLNPEVDLVDVLNGGEFTVFAPVDDAFAALPMKTVAALSKPANADMLSGILTYHVVEGQIPPSDITGSQTTVQGDAVEVTGSGDDLKVNDANVICGGVQTANATVYLIDSVLTPPM
jgi:uncharacterized surface protein with fasciclin (FAS1) repeats